jgi:hypothetical protein
VDCKRYCPYVDPSSNENVPYWAEQDGAQSAAVLSLREQGAAAGTKVAGTFGALGKTCGDFHLVQFDSTLSELTSYTVMVGYSDSATFSTGASVGGCSLTRGPASLAGGLPVLLALLGLAILRQSQRR